MKSGDTSTPRAQLAKYLEEEGQHPSPALDFWTSEGTKDKYPALYRLAMKTLCVPASSAPVERIFSRGGIIMRPHRARLFSKMFETIMFLKCNEKVL